MGTLHFCTTSSFGAAELHHLVGVTESESNCSDGVSRVSICCLMATQMCTQSVERMLPELKAGRRVKPGRRGQFRRTTVYSRQWMDRPNTTYRINGDIYTCYFELFLVIHSRTHIIGQGIHIIMCNLVARSGKDKGPIMLCFALGLEI